MSTRCSRTRGPASAPSLVTCPTSTHRHAAALGLDDELAGRTRGPGPPSRAPTPSSLVGDRLDAVDDARASASRCSIGVDDAAQRRLRRDPHVRLDRCRADRRAAFTCCGALLRADVQRRAAPRRRRAAVTSVLLPMPGSPPSSVTEPGTRPPPSTRSSSPIDVGRGAPSWASTSSRQTDRGERREHAAAGSLPPPPRASPRRSSSTPRTPSTAPTTWRGARRTRRTPTPNAPIPSTSRLAY